MKTSLPERAVIEDFIPRKGRLLKTSLPERALIEYFTPGKGGY